MEDLGGRLIAAVFGGAIGASFAALFGVWSRWWQYRRELWSSRVSHFCDHLQEFGESAARYWLKASLTDSQKSGVSAADRHRARQHQEIVLIGSFEKLTGLIESFARRLDESDQRTLDSLINKLNDAAMGGDFQSGDYESDPERARDIYAFTSDIVVHIWHATDRAITFGGWWKYVRQRASRRQNAAINGACPTE